MSLPIFYSDNKDIQLIQNAWSQPLNNVLSTPIISGLLLKNINLINGITVINHLLSRQMVGWMIADIDGAAIIYRSAPFNTKTLSLTSNAAIVCNLWVF